MLPKTMLGLVLAAVAVVTFAIPASAQDSGLAAMHALRREGGKLCMADHWHYGSSGTSSTKAAAQRARHRLLAGLHRSRVRPHLGALQPRRLQEDRLLAQQRRLDVRRRSPSLPLS